MKRGCKCGRYDATEAGYQQMTPTARATFDRNTANCVTCKYDREGRINQRKPA